MKNLSVLLMVSMLLIPALTHAEGQAHLAKYPRYLEKFAQQIQGEEKKLVEINNESGAILKGSGNNRSRMKQWSLVNKSNIRLLKQVKKVMMSLDSLATIDPNHSREAMNGVESEILLLMMMAHREHQALDQKAMHTTNDPAVINAFSRLIEIRKTIDKYSLDYVNALTPDDRAYFSEVENGKYVS